MKRRLISMMAAGALLLSAMGASLGVPMTAQATAAAGGAAVYVDVQNGADTNAGTEEAPVQTLKKAQELARAQGSNVTVCLRGGEYVLEEPMAFDSNDSGQTWTSYEGEEAVISGGTKITGWTQYDAEKNIWSAPAQGVISRELYVNGERALFSRCDKVSVADNSAFFNSVTLKKEGLPDTFKNPEDLELAVRATRWWSVLPLESVETSEELHRLFIEEKAMNAYRSLARGETGDEEDIREKYVLFIQNDYELIDQPGEWYLDKGEDTVYYKPRDNEDMSAADARLGRMESLFELRGVKNFRISGLTFAETTWLQGNEPEGTVCPRQGTYLNGSSPETYPLETIEMDGMNAIYGESLDNVEITGNKFRNIGGNAVYLEDAVKNSSITDNDVYDVGACGIIVGGMRAKSENPTPQTLTENNVIKGNYLRSIGAIHQASAAIQVGYAARTMVEYNTIDGCSRIGIRIGSWQGTRWAFYDDLSDVDVQEAQEQRTIMRERDKTWKDRFLTEDVLTVENRVAHNRIMNMHYETTWNANGIYCMGKTADTVITGNYISWSQGSGIQLDIGSCGFTVSNNAMEDVQKAVENEGDYINAYSNYCGAENKANGGKDPSSNAPQAFGEAPVTLFEDNDMWDEAAVEAIKTASGVEGMGVAYEDPELKLVKVEVQTAEPEPEETATPEPEPKETATPEPESKESTPADSTPTETEPETKTDSGTNVLPIVIGVVVVVACGAGGVLAYRKKKSKKD